MRLISSIQYLGKYIGVFLSLVGLACPRETSAANDPKLLACLLEKSAPVSAQKPLPFAQAVKQFEGNAASLAAEIDPVRKINDPRNLPYLKFAGPAPAYQDQVVVLVHGLSDGPNVMRGIAEAYQQWGYNVVVVRLKGHGTTVQDLKNATAADWVQDVNEGVKTAHSLGQHVSIVGFSTGGALAIDHAFTSPTDVEWVEVIAPLIGFKSKLAHAASFLKYLGVSSKREGNPGISAYSEIPAAAVEQAGKVTRTVQAQLRGGKSSVPIGVSWSGKDNIVDGKAIQKMIQQQDIPLSRQTYVDDDVPHRDLPIPGLPLDDSTLGENPAFKKILAGLKERAIQAKKQGSAALDGPGLK